jgi:proteasome assembly chaperone (PAC2) family protein
MSKKIASKKFVKSLHFSYGIAVSGKITLRFNPMEIHQIPALRNPVMVVAFSGWSDAGEAATGAVEHLLSAWQNEPNDVVPELVADIDSEDYYDFQVNRPHIFVDDSQIRNISWPTTEIYALVLPNYERDLVVVKGTEPSLRWKSFSRELLDLADDLETSLVITLGALLADVPHTRPIGVSGSGAHPDIAARLGVETSRYEGPTGILGVLGDGCLRRGIDAISLWAAIPHYASGSPSPKATLSLINALEDFLEVTIPSADLPEAAEEWEKDVNDMAKEDTDVAEYVKALEDSKDAAELPEVSGDSIAKEFERYLRRRTQD